jgi:ribulose-phosphate 3-epimerase
MTGSGAQSSLDDAGRKERTKAFRAQSAPLITPSLLSCDFGRVADILAELESARAPAVHLDVMDGHFVPNLTYGPPLISSWRSLSRLPFDAHLMITDPVRHIDAYIDAGCDSISFQIEAVPHPRTLLHHIRAAGCLAGLVLNPPTPIEELFPYLDDVDSVLVMSVMPGFGGQAFDPVAIGKLERLHARRPDLHLSVDGGVNQANAAACVRAGASQLVIGSAVFNSGQPLAATLSALAQTARQGLQGGDMPVPTAVDPTAK